MTELSAAFYERLRQDVPEGHTPDSGYCFRDALAGAGYNTDLPPWIHIDDIPIVCEELGLNYKTGKGDTVSFKKMILVSLVILYKEELREKNVLAIGLFLKEQRICLHK